MNRVILPKLTKYATKDQHKSDAANCFIGVGSSKSSTHAYAQAWGDRANMLKYSEDSIAFVSAEGDRRWRVSPRAVIPMLEALKRSGGLAITDNRANTERPYNTGEREVQGILRGLGFLPIDENEFFMVWQPL